MEDTRKEVMTRAARTRTQTRLSSPNWETEFRGREWVGADVDCLPPRSILFGLHGVKSARCMKRLYRMLV